MRPLGHRGFVARKVVRIGVDIGVTEQHGQLLSQIPTKIAIIEADPAHPIRVVDAEIGDHVPAAICGDRGPQQRSSREREIAEDVLRACRETKHAELSLIAPHVLEQVVDDGEVPPISRIECPVRRRQPHVAVVVSARGGDAAASNSGTRTSRPKRLAIAAIELRNTEASRSKPCSVMTIWVSRLAPSGQK